MYIFAVTVLLGLALLTVVDVLTDLVPNLSKLRGAVAIVLAVAGTFVLDYSLFEGFGVTLRDTWMGIVLTGVAVAGTANAWRALFAWLGSPDAGEPGSRPSTRRLVGKAA